MLNHLSGVVQGSSGQSATNQSINQSINQSKDMRKLHIMSRMNQGRLPDSV